MVGIHPGGVIVTASSLVLIGDMNTQTDMQNPNTLSQHIGAVKMILYHDTTRGRVVIFVAKGRVLCGLPTMPTGKKAS